MSAGRGCFLRRAYGDFVVIGFRHVETVPSVGICVGLKVGVSGFVIVRHGIAGCSGWSEKGTV